MAGSKVHLGTASAVVAGLCAELEHQEGLSLSARMPTAFAQGFAALASRHECCLEDELQQCRRGSFDNEAYESELQH